MVLGLRGADRIRGGNGKDKLYGGRGNDVIFSEGSFREVVKCGRGIETAYVDSRDQVTLCERRR